MRGSTFADVGDDSWAPCPPPEDVYERLEEFFPEHDLDKLVIEARLGGLPRYLSSGDRSAQRREVKVSFVRLIYVVPCDLFTTSYVWFTVLC